MKKLNMLIDENIPETEKIFSDIGNIRMINGREIQNKDLNNIDVLIIRSVTNVNAELLKGSAVKFVGTATIGIDHIDEDYLKKNKIEYSNAKGSNANSVAEYVLTAIFYYCYTNKIDIRSIVLGVIGAGNTGEIVSNKAEKLGIKVLRNDPPLEEKGKKKRFYPIDELLNADFITLHTPLIKDGKYPTYKLFNDSLLNKVSKNTVLINTARGGVIDNNILNKFIINEKINGAILDVWEDEPAININLLKAVCLSTPHIAGYSWDGKINGAVMIRNKICDFFNIRPKIKVSDIINYKKNQDIELVSYPSYEETIYKVIKEVYDIKADSEKLKKMLLLDNKNKQIDHFNKLRKDYPKRREFRNYRVKIKKDSGFYFRLKKDLHILGFEIQ